MSTRILGNLEEQDLSQEELNHFPAELQGHGGGCALVRFSLLLKIPEKIELQIEKVCSVS